jgi:hypothetical protein
MICLAEIVVGLNEKWEEDEACRRSYNGWRRWRPQLARPGVLDYVRGRSNFSRFDPRPERPHFSNFGPPTERRPVGRGGGVFVAQNRRTLAELVPSDCKRPSLAGLVPIWSRTTLVDLTPKYPTLVPL